MNIEKPSNEKNNSEKEMFVELTPLEKPAEIDAVKKYEEENISMDKFLEKTKNDIKKLSTEISLVRGRLFDEDISVTEEAPSIKLLREKLEQIEEEKIRTSANYPGDWTLLLMERMLDPITKEKFIKTRQEAMSSMNSGEVGPIDKPKTFASHYKQQIDNYDANVIRIFNSTEYKRAEDVSKKPINLGMGNIGGVGAVFIDARAGEKELTSRQKNIIESHEKGHGLRDFTAPTDRRDFALSINYEIVSELEKHEQEKNPEKRFANYLTQPDEVAERMAQLKNYFGMRAGDVFTKKHLEYAKEHYIQDTGLDNSMSVFFSAIDGSVIDKFIETINKYPL